MVEYDQPPELDGEPEDSRMLPPVPAAAARVSAFIRASGDGCYDVVDDGGVDIPLYARDLEVLVQHAEGRLRP